MRSGPRSVVLSMTSAASTPWRAARSANSMSSKAATSTSAAGTAGEDRAEPDEDLPLLRAVVAREDRRRPARRAAHGEAPQRLVAVRLLERRQAGQDHVGVARGLVQPVVDADHRVEHRQRFLEPAGVRGGQRRVAGHDDQRRGPGPRPGSRSPRPGTRSAPGRAPPGALRTRVCQRPVRTGPRRRAVWEMVAIAGRREHRPALDVEVAGQHVDDVDRPRGERAELLVAQADPAVDDGALGLRRARGPAAGSARRARRRRRPPPRG